ncbi:unnamed protein product [Arabis nemorensis]|uniref:Acidic protein n=1 Tax=Arabis nemorensis TaxID=586526 RepID=A0A565B757_9BRAS|nr:unnamed protein product [Arabis nemorensis]
MEGKTMIVSVLIMSLVMAQIQVEAATTCCPTTKAKTAYNFCRLRGDTKEVCAYRNGCKIIEEDECPPNLPLQNIGDVVNEYCKLGCASSVCGALTTLQNSDSSEIVNGAVEQCTKACSTFCTKAYKPTAETV